MYYICKMKKNNNEPAKELLTQAQQQGWTLYKIVVRAGISYGSLIQVQQGKCGLNAANMEKLRQLLSGKFGQPRKTDRNEIVKVRRHE